MKLTATEIDVAGTRVTLAVDENQLLARHEGDLITAVILSVAPPRVESRAG